MLVQRPSLKAGKGTAENFLAEEGRRTDNKREEEKVSVKQTSGKSTFTQTQVANDGSQSHQAAQEVFLAEKRAAEDTIQRQDVPAGYRKYLETYFKGIEPDAGAPDDGK
ncbi:MAG: hypothetical protein R3F49_24115 [Planctomycetota bacterium]